MVWIRERVTLAINTEPWHVVLNTTPGGVRVSSCAGVYGVDEAVETRNGDDPPPIDERCLVCDRAGASGGAIAAAAI